MNYYIYSTKEENMKAEYMAKNYLMMGQSGMRELSKLKPTNFGTEMYKSIKETIIIII